MENNDGISTTRFSGKYLNGSAKDALLDFSQNSYIIKDGTGMGATTNILKNTVGNYIIISPNTGMIKSKENPTLLYGSDKQAFLYKDSVDTWGQVSKYLDETPIENQNLIISTTAEQILKIKSKIPDLYGRLKIMFVFIDEIHSFAHDSSYRNTLGEFMELVYHDWEASFKVSTATPIYNHIDIPRNMNIDYQRLERENEPTKPIMISPNFKDYKEFVYREHAEGRKVVVFSNNADVHKDFRDLKVINLVGKTLRVKLLEFGRGNVEDDPNLGDYDVIILSSSYFAGFDLELDCSICVVSEQRIGAYKINHSNFIQAYGRCRQKVHNALYINATAKKDRNGKKLYYPKTLNDVNILVDGFHKKLEYYQSMLDQNQYFDNQINRDFITPDGYVNRLKLLNDTLHKVNDYHQYNPDVLQATLELYDFSISEYQSVNLKIKSFRRLTFKDRLNNLAQLSITELSESYKDIIKGLKYKDEGVFTYDIALIYLTVYLIKIADANVILDKLDNKSLKPCEIYHSVDLFLRANVNTDYYYKQSTLKEAEYGQANYTNEYATLFLKLYNDLTDNWQLLYAIYRSKNQCFSEHINRVLSIHEEVHKKELYETLKDNKKHRYNKAYGAISKALKQLKIILSTNEMQWIKERSRSLFERLGNGKKPYYVTRKSLINDLMESLGYLLTEGEGNHKSKEIKNREYYPLIHLPKELRTLIPLKYLIIDLDSSNPQIVDSMIGSNIGLKVYDNIMNALECSRDEAKTEYNKTLNRHYLKLKDAIDFYMICGYTEDESKRLARLTTGVKKGEFYERTTENEKLLMKNYSDYLIPKSHRFHDAVIVKMESVQGTHIGLPLVVKGYKYHINIFNDGGDYKGLVI